MSKISDREIAASIAETGTEVPSAEASATAPTTGM